MSGAPIAVTGAKLPPARRRLRTARSGESGLAPRAWAEWAGGQQPIAVRAELSGALLQRWSSTAPSMAQPPLDHHLVVLHLGGPKRVLRWSGRRTTHVDIRSGAHTMVPAGSAYRWLTAGPIDFAHLFVHPDRFTRDVTEGLDLAPEKVRFDDVLGRDDPIVSTLFALLLEGCAAGQSGEEEALGAEERLTRLNVRLAMLAGASQGGALDAPLPAPRVARVRDYVQANLAGAIALDDLAREGGMSRYHFIRAFRAATGLTPYAFVLAERVAVAVEALRYTDRSIAQIAADTGFSSPARLSERFRALIGQAPAEFRRSWR